MCKHTEDSVNINIQTIHNSSQTSCNYDSDVWMRFMNSNKWHGEPYKVFRLIRQLFTAIISWIRHPTSEWNSKIFSYV